MASLSRTTRGISCFLADSFEHLPPAAFLDALDSLQQAGVRELRLLDGEPARHPDFAWMLTRALERGFRLLIATTGRMPHAILKKIERLPPEAVRVLVHAAVPGESSPAERERQVNLFRRLGPRVLLAVWTHSPSAPLGFVLDLIERYGLDRQVRIEMAPGLVEEDLQDRLAALAAAGVRVELHESQASGGCEPPARLVVEPALTATPAP